MWEKCLRGHRSAGASNARRRDQSQDIDSARDLSSRLADTRFVAIERSDHFIHIDAPDQWAEEVAKFEASLPEWAVSIRGEAGIDLESCLTAFLSFLIKN